MALPVITRYRGDTWPDKFILTDDDGVVLDISSGYTFEMTVDTKLNPPDNTTNLYTLTGVVTNGPTGAFEFRPSSANTNRIGTFYYDVQVVDPDTFKRTVEKGKYVFSQDINKT